MKKRIITMILTISMLLGSVVLYSVGADANASGHGDVDGDGEVTILDLFILKTAMFQKETLSEAAMYGGDSDRDEAITMVDLFEMKYRIKKGEWRVNQEIPVYTLYTMEEFRAFVEDPSVDMSSSQTSALYDRVNGWCDVYFDRFSLSDVYGHYSWEIFREDGNIVSNDLVCYDKDLIDNKWFGINYYDSNLAVLLFNDYNIKKGIQEKTGNTIELIESIFIVEVKSWVPAVSVVLADGEYFFIEISERAVIGAYYDDPRYYYDYKLYTYEEYYEKYKDADYAYIVSPDGERVQTQYIVNGRHSGKIDTLVPLSLVFKAIGGEVTYNEEKTVIYYSYDNNHYLVALTEDNGIVEYPGYVYKQNEDGVYESVRMTLWGGGAGTYHYIDGTEYLFSDELMKSYIIDDLGYTGKFVGNDFYLSEIK